MSAAASRGAILVAGGYGVVGSRICRLLRERHPDAALLIGGRSPDKGAELVRQLGAKPVRIDTSEADPLALLDERPSLVISAVNDPHDALLLAAVTRGIALVDIARWTARLHAALLRLSTESLSAPVVLASGWMGGVAPLLAMAAARQVWPPTSIEIDILYGAADLAGPDSVDYVDRLDVPFEVIDAGRERLVKPFTDGRVVTFPEAGRRRTYRLDTPEQATLPIVTGASTVATRIVFDSRAATATLVAFKRLGVIRLLSAERFTRLRRKLLFPQNTSTQGTPTIVLATVRGEGAVVRASIVDREGQSHLTALGAVIAAERALGLDGLAAAPEGVTFPEQHPRPQTALTTLRQHGGEVVIEAVERRDAESTCGSAVRCAR
ncbi:MAG: saccharopine dehydrogenase [Deltaproteobacteria bacterium]|nr:saccharopine dehydrogenase [Deltaproteobacteria bacterium]